MMGIGRLRVIPAVALAVSLAAFAGPLLVPQPILGQVLSCSGPLLTVRESATAILGEGTRTQVYEKAKREALRKAIELGRPSWRESADAILPRPCLP